MSAYVLLNLYNDFGKSENMRGLLLIGYQQTELNQIRRRMAWLLITFSTVYFQDIQIRL